MQCQYADDAIGSVLLSQTRFVVNIACRDFEGDVTPHYLIRKNFVGLLPGKMLAPLGRQQSITNYHLTVHPIIFESLIQHEAFHFSTQMK